MKDQDASATHSETFVNADQTDKRIASILSNPSRRKRVDRILAEMDAGDRTYRMSLASVRQAAHFSQVELAKSMGVSQPRISELENGDDYLLSTFANYLAASGATKATVLVTVNNTTVELDLDLPTRN